MTGTAPARAWYRPRPRARRAVTLVELALAMAVFGIIAVGVAGAFAVVVKGVPSPTGRTASVAAAHDLQALLASELRSATSVVALSATGITFVVPDRNNDGADETIRYYGSGTAGGPVRRVYNGADAVLVSSVQSFALTFEKRSQDRTQSVTTTSTSSEQLLASFTAYASGTTTAKDYAVASTGTSGTSGWAAEYFVPTLPAGVNKVNITKAQVMMRNFAGGAGSSTVAIHRAQGGGNPNPMTTPLGTPFTVSNASLGASYAWVTATFSDVFVSNANQDFCLVLKGPSSTSSGYLRYLSQSKGPSDTPMMMWSINSGSSWGPSNNAQNNQDIPFYVYGTYTTSSTTQQTVTDYYLRSVGVTVRCGTDAAARVDAAVRVLNQPKVTGL